jgi:hypothetical protein
MSLILMNNAIGKTAESTASRESTATKYGNPHFAFLPAKPTNHYPRKVFRKPVRQSTVFRPSRRHQVASRFFFHFNMADFLSVARSLQSPGNGPAIGSTPGRQWPQSTAKEIP